MSSKALKIRRKKKFVPSFQEIKGNGKMGLRKVSLATA